jgi:hypothetical protein
MVAPLQRLGMDANKANDGKVDAYRKACAEKITNLSRDAQDLLTIARLRHCALRHMTLMSDDTIGLT